MTSLELDERYSRQVLFRGIGAEGQRKLTASRIAIVGCGATGSALASLLTRAGVGTIRIIDRDYVEPSNLQRQSLFDEADAVESLPKAIAASRKIAAFNSAIAIEPHVADLTLVRLAGVSHWVQQEAADRVNGVLRNWLGQRGLVAIDPAEHTA